MNTCPADHGYEATARVVVVNNGQETLVGAKFCPLCGTTLERVCPTNHTAPNGQKWTDFEWFVCEGGEDYEKWSDVNGVIYAHCPDCGQSLKGAGE